MSAPPFLKVKDFPFLEARDTYKVSTCLLLLEILENYKTMQLVCTDFTNNIQNKEGNYKRNRLDIPSGQIICIPMLPKEFEALNKSYNEFYNDSYNLVQEYKDNGFVDVADKLIVITLNLKLRLYNRVLEPYLYDPEMVEYQLCDKRELEVVRSLFKEIIKRNAYFKLVKERCHKLMPPDLVSETTSTAERSNSYVPVVSIENSSEYTELADVEFSDEFDDQSSDIYPTEPKIYSISEIKQVPMSLDEEVYPISGKVYATFPDDWSFIAGKVGKGDVISIRDLELIVGDVNINEDTILDDRNSLSIILQRDELLKYTKSKSPEHFYCDVSRAKQEFYQMMSSLKLIQIKKGSKKINSLKQKIVWKFVEAS
ncbi:MAG: hypothetical protein M5F18_11245 [Asgard group archaeon]|nr:hypothetical protein [Asgard group archaeon]